MAKQPHSEARPTKQEQEAPAVRTDWLQLHAARLQTMLEVPFPDRQNILCWRTRYIRDALIWSVRMWRQQGGPTQVNAITMGTVATNVGDGNGVDLACWLGLWCVDPEMVEWNRVAVAPAERGSPLAIVRDPLPPINGNGRQ